MKTAYTTLLTILTLAGASMAGVAPAPMGKGPVPPPPAPTCNCFGPGGQFSLYAAGLMATTSDGSEIDDTLGAGLAAGYFFNSYFGIEGDATWFFDDSTIHSFSGSVVLRYPIVSACLAPYIFAGGGVHANSDTYGTWHAGAGIDVRFTNCMGIFADGRYVWTDNENTDYAIFRVGFRTNF